MMTNQEFHDAQQHNTKILNTILETGSPAGLEKIQFWEKPKKVSFDVTLSKGFDILGCCAIGAIPSIKQSGADGYAYFNNNPNIPQEIETKVSTIDSSFVTRGPLGGISISTPGYNSTPTGITSALSGRFNPYVTESTLETKARHTALIAFDRDYNQIIDAWMMDPDTVIQQLKSGKSLSLSLAKFLRHGWNVHTPVKKIGWNKWKSQF